MSLPVATPYGRMLWRTLFILALVLVSCGRRPMTVSTEMAPGIAYTNFRVASQPWSVHVAAVDYRKNGFELHSVHASNAAVGLTTLSEQVRMLAGPTRQPVAAVNGDFYERTAAFAGDPRGMQVVSHELISGPIGGVTFWIDASGQPHATNVHSLFQVEWPGGISNTFGLNEQCASNQAVLYTPAIGATTKALAAVALILERADSGPWLPLVAGEDYAARVAAVREGGDSPIGPQQMVLCLGPELARRLPPVQQGILLKLSTHTRPSLRGSSMALSGGPLLGVNGRRVPLPRVAVDGPLPYQYRSMWERHPRSAIGWNDRRLFLVTVDGRQKELSVGMTLDELGDFLLGLGCKQVVNLDGGGSATLWCDGRVRNSPCDKKERPIANALVVVKKSGS